MERPISVLVVAGHDALREALAGLLNREVITGDVRATGNRAEALATAARQHPDLIVIDTHRLADWRDLCHDLHAASDDSKLAVLHGKLPGKQDATPLLPASHLDKSTRATDLVHELLKVAAIETVVS
jgi:CheY-like chemotaxis protein